ncbi:MAG: peptidylprolyl isomerase [Planctomycetes bacterium]|nr:peptidylprolyl isomerase [Planctomycetota bacterium]
MTRSFTALAAALLLAVGPAAAQDAPLPAAGPLQLTAALDAAEVEVGGAIGLTVTLKNTGQEPVEVMGVEGGALFEDRAVVSFDIQLDDGKVFTVSRIHPRAEAPRTDWPRATLKPGEAAELKVSLPALTAGAWHITAGYRRGTDKALAAPKVTAQVKPTAQGATDVEVTMLTSMGPIRMRLLPREALGTSLNFARLATQGVVLEDGRRRARFYDGLTFHRVIPGFMVQGGCPQGNGLGGPGYNLPAEFAEQPVKDELKHVPGRVSMARAGHNDSAGCQFFICVGEPSHLDGQYTVFGEVTRGLDVAKAIAGVETIADSERSRPAETVRIISVRLAPAPTRS